jgi:flagellar biosynthetic protein FliP
MIALADPRILAATATTIPLPTVGKPSQSIVSILLLTVLAVAPALVVCLTSFTRIVIVLALTRNALGAQNIPPNQVIIGLSLFLSLFIMSPTLTQMNHDGLQPYLKGTLTAAPAFAKAEAPLHDWMAKQTRPAELNMMLEARHEKPASVDKVSMTALAPAFILSEIKTAFLMGFVIFIPFLVIDLVVSATLMSMGMMMLPPTLVSLPFKLLLFVLVDGWALVTHSLLVSFR